MDGSTPPAGRGDAVADATSRFDPRFARVFAWIAERQLRRAFHAVRLERRSRRELDAMRSHEGPLLLLVSHPSWWDPMVVALLRRRFFHDRSIIAPMDAHELARFRVFARLGVFPLDPDDPASAERLVSETTGRWRAEPRGLCVITPQGRFTDPREPTRLRPGAAMVAAAAPGAMSAVAALEYPFWSSRRPEALLRIRRVTVPDAPGVRAWHRAFVSAMEENRRELADLAVARDPATFETIVAGGAVGGLYARWLRLIGRGSEIDAARRARRPAPGPEAPA